MATKSKKSKPKRSGDKKETKKIKETKASEAPVYKKSVGKLTKIIGVKCPERIINCVVGSQATGKTQETKKLIKRYIKRFPKEKVLIIDPNDEYTEYPKITIDKIADFKKPSRISVYGMDMDSRKNLLKNIAWKYRNGLLVIEDFYAIFPNLHNSFEFIGAISCCRTRDIDVILTFQSINSIPIKITQNTFAFRFHHTFDNINESFRFISPYIKIPIDYVNLQSRWIKFTHVYFDVVNQQIIGVKNQESLFYACTEFYKPTINSLVKRLMYGQN